MKQKKNKKELKIIEENFEIYSTAEYYGTTDEENIRTHEAIKLLKEHFIELKEIVEQNKEGMTEEAVANFKQTIQEMHYIVGGWSNRNLVARFSGHDEDWINASYDDYVILLHKTVYYFNNKLRIKFLTFES